MDTFQIKTAIYSGSNSLERLSSIKNKKIWIICDKFLVESKGLVTLLSYLDDSNTVKVFSDIVPDPPIGTIAKGVGEAERIQPEIMIAFGGGSAIDTAKGIMLFAKKGNVQIGKLIAIPTTSGTGSEVTAASVITDPKTKVKYPLFLEELIPDEAILDPGLVVSVPAKITANTGMDVLTHALEAYVSTKATLYTDAFAEKAARLVLKYLVKCYQDGGDLISRERMHIASNMAGLAFSQANLGLNHSIAHQLGAHFHIPHGLANAMLLRGVITFNAENCTGARHKYAEIARLCGLSPHHFNDRMAVSQLMNKIDDMMDEMNMAKTLTECGIEKDAVAHACCQIAENALNDACYPTNPVHAAASQIEKIIKKII
ncbi:iron-containing alcohol dehydrogenase [Bacillaceae bacterium Marseille-Q3522]|nr:iron-containing alcohol dehydrogenase [Bacillaceae bacterium Marseille-Q3522]